MTVIRSIQGEQQAASPAGAGHTFATVGEVDAYVDGASDAVLVCRARGRHLFPTPDRRHLTFDGVTDDDLLTRRVQCEVCKLVWLTEFWGTTGRGRNYRVTYVGSRLEYRRDPATGEQYTSSPGAGRITARMIRDSLATAAMQGQSVAAIRRALRQQGQHGGAA